ncbi:MAG: HAD family hydrolase [Cytophagaceae bacterium]|nr:HAD family hydrolase [Gemmatimonadaceae bacterium]
MLDALGHSVPALEFETLYHDSAVEANRWWRDEHRGYKTADRIRWILERLAIDRPEDCAHIAHAVDVIDETLLKYPAPLLSGAHDAIAALHERFALAIISDTGFASGTAQNRLLAQDGLSHLFSSTIYSMDIGHAKPRPEIFRAALDALGLPPDEVLHVGDNERTDVGGALDMGLRAVRLDAVRDSGPTRAEFVARSLPELAAYLGRVVG